ncbi:hypothetical protein M9458_043549, partial [Cirrhinus mrigala]
STLPTNDRTLEDYTSKKYEHDIPTTLEDSPVISTNTPTLTISVFTTELHSDSELEVGQDATQGLGKTAGVTIQHEEVDIVSESTLMTTDRTLEDYTSKKYEHDILTTLEDSPGISTNTPTLTISEFTEELYSDPKSEVGQDATESSGKTLSATIQHEKVDTVSESTLMTTDKKYEHGIPTNLEDSPGISTNTPAVIISEFTEQLHSESEPEMGQDTTQGSVTTDGVTIQHEKVDAISKSTLMTTDRTPEDSTSGKYENIIPTSSEDSLEIIGSSELTNEATVKQDVTEGTVRTSYVTIPHEEFTLMTSAGNPKDSSSGKYEYDIPTDSLGISTNTPTEITSESTEEVISVTKLNMGQGVTEGPVKSIDATTPLGSTSIKTDLPTTLEDSPGISTNTPVVITRESIENLISETEVEDGLGVTESPVKSALVTIEHADVLEATVMSTGKPPIESPTEISPVQSVLPEEPVQTATTELKEVLHNPSTEGLPKAKADKDVVEITHVTTVPGILSPTTRVNTSPDVVSTEDGTENIAIVTLLDKYEEEDAPYTKPTPEVATGEELQGAMTESTHTVSKETHESIDDSHDAKEDHLGKEEDIITETPKVVEVTAGETPRLTLETTEATESVSTEKEEHVDEDTTATGKPGEMTTEVTDVPEVDFEDNVKVTALENAPEDFDGGTSEATADLGNGTKPVILEESPEESPEETSTKTASQTTPGITSKDTLDTSLDISTPETDIAEFATEGTEDKVEDTTKKDEGGEETLPKVSQDTVPDFTVTELEKDIPTTTINEDIHEVTEPSTIPEDTPKVTVEITHEVTRGDPLSETPEVATETPKVITEADVITETTYVISQAPEVEKSGSISKTPEVASLTPLSISEFSDVPRTVPKTPDTHVVQQEPAEDDIPTPILKVEDITVVLND